MNDRRRFVRSPLSQGLLLVLSTAAPAIASAEGAGFDEEVLVVAPTPLGRTGGLDPERLPFTTQSTDADALERAQSLDLTEHLNQNLGSVSINSAQNNPLQPDVQYRGYSASPLLGLPIGVSVYQNGVRVNEPLGDTVNWDLLPESAIHSLTLVGGANPLFGLNTLGGALSVEMKNGFNFQGHELEAYGGSWGRAVTSAQSGGNNGSFGYYANVSYFREDGWRDESDSDALNVYGSASWRGEKSAANLNLQYADTDLRGNGASPRGLLAIDREQIFTAPDITENDMHMVSFDLTHAVTDSIEFAGNAFYRHNTTDSFNGDASEYQECALGNGDFLLDEVDEEGLEALGLDEDDVCENNDLGVADPDALEAALNALAGDPEAFDLDDLTDELTGTLALSDAAINNRSTREQEAYGTDLQLSSDNRLFARDNYFVVGFNWTRGNADFDGRVELSDIDPVTRSTEGLGLGTFVAEGATSIRTRSETWSLYFLDNLAVTERFTFTFGGRYNDTDIRLRDRSGERRELNGDHDFSRFNPTVGGTFSVNDAANLFASYSESARAPTPVELACNDGVFELAQRIAVENGEDPDDIEFECRLPNAFLADPPLDQVVAKSVEFGVRGVWHDIEHRIGYFRTVNHDDIIFQSTGRATGLFANVDETKREGVEAAFAGSLRGIDWFTAYSYVEASFESAFSALSPHHAFADANGEIQVQEGDRIPGIPRHQLKLGADYRLPFGLALGAELLYNSDQVLRGDESNQLETLDGYATVNLRGSYAFSKQVELFARVTNLFDEDYENFGLIGEDPTEVLPNLSDDSPLFLGAGAPRAGWVGLRIRL
ncbi:MAG TPA: TonB-dependent receptor [Gammaproteobacteria bacterium]|nr:TonB-dependent receptor [Gammaproteobacteria bacterium]